jgi:hypothetical protein
MTTTALTGDALLAKAATLDSTITATEKVTACGYLNDNGKVDYVGFYTALIAAKGLNEPTEDPEMGEVEADLRERFGDEAVDAFIEVWSVDDLEGFEDAYQGEWESGAKFVEEFVGDCYGTSNLPSFIEIDWEATWQNLRYDYCEQDGFIFNVNW